MRDKSAFLARTGFRRSNDLALRFAVDHGALKRLENSALAADCSRGEKRERRFTTRFLDTPDLTLKAAGIELCLAKAAGRYFQITKSKAGRANNYKPSFEVETELHTPGDLYRPIRTGFSAMADEIIQSQTQHLQPFLRIETERHSKEMSYGQAAMLWIVEHGEVKAGFPDRPAGRTPFHHFILTFVRGDVHAFFAFVRGLATECQLQLTGLTPEQIGRQLFKSETTPFAKATKYPLSVDDTAHDVARKAFTTALRQIAGNKSAAAEGHPEAIKQMRVGLRRLRSLERLFRRSFRDQAFRNLVSQAKEYGKILGYARDWDVFIEQTVPNILLAETFERTDAGVLEALLEQAAEQKSVAKQDVRALVTSDGFTRFCIDLAEAVGVATWQVKGREDLTDPATDYAARVLDNRLEKVMAMGANLATAPAHARHPLRVELKKFRYAIHAFRPLYPKEVRKPYLSALSQLQDEFGILNDAVVARSMALAASAPAHRSQTDDIRRAIGASFVAGWSAQQLEGQAEAVFQAWQAFAALTPFWHPQPEAGKEMVSAQDAFSAGEAPQ